ncbi:hypothetical protein [Demequina aestuarii]|uniref:hypothetical protein n=1 Tax=Demequina aestuarii TaxID=327095 RepID=UPI0007859BAE|nr:hypothetical protein [Demequina aestuarii]
MAGGTLRVDTAAVRDVATDLTTVHRELTGAGDRSHAVADAVGHAALGDSLRRFSDAWDDRRQELAEQITVLRDAATGIAQSFDDVDYELASALAEDGS